VVTANTVMTVGFFLYKVEDFLFKLSVLQEWLCCVSYLLTGSRHQKTKFYESNRQPCQISPMKSSIHKSAVKYTVSQAYQK